MLNEQSGVNVECVLTVTHASRNMKGEPSEGHNNSASTDEVEVCMKCNSSLHRQEEIIDLSHN